MNTDTPAILVCDEQARVTLHPLRRENPDSTDYWDSNWIVTRIQATAPGFHADITEPVHLSELVWLREELETMRAVLAGRIVWKAMEGFLELVAEMDRLGHIRWTVLLRHFNGHFNGKEARLLLEIENDQTYLPALVNEVDAVLETFPVVGEPR